MSDIKNYGLAGLGSAVQFGKQGGTLRFTTSAPNGSGGNAPAFQVRNAANSDLLRLQVATPLHATDATTKLYVDSLVQGLNVKSAVRAATTGNIALTGTHPLTIDGIALANTNRVLVKNQTNATQNGIYVYSVDTGNYLLTRAPDANNVDVNGQASNEVAGGMFTFVEEGLILADTGWVMSSPNGVANLGTDSLVFTQFSSAGIMQGGAGILKTGNVFSAITDGVTTYIDGTQAIAVRSSATTGQVLRSVGSGTAEWGALNLATPAAITGILPVANGGTGMSTYAAGDLVLATSANVLGKLAKGINNTALTIDNGGVIGYRYITELRDVAGRVAVQSTATTGATNYLDVQNSAGSDNLIVAAKGSGLEDDVGITFTVKGDGLLRASEGYDAYVLANRELIGENTIVTKGYVEARVDSIDTTSIRNEANTTFVATEEAGYANKVAVASNNKVVAEFVGSGEDGVAESGERLRVSHVTDEVQISAVNASGIGSVNFRLIPQDQGQVFIGQQGAGLIQGEDGYRLTVKGGEASATEQGGDLILLGGSASGNDLSGGSVRIRAGEAHGTGTRGSIYLEDTEENTIAEFKGPAGSTDNWFEFTSASSDPDNLVAGLKIGVAQDSASPNVSVYFRTKGTGMVRTTDNNAYLLQLQSSGNEDAFVTKAYVGALVGAAVKTSGVGLSETVDTLNVNVNATTIKVDGSNNLILASNGTVGHVLMSTGTTGAEAVFGALPLNSTTAITGTLGVSNGGTGITSYTANDIVIGAAGGGLAKLAKGANNQFLGINASGNLAYSYMGNLRDANGVIALQVAGVASAVNSLSVKNAIAAGAVEINTAGADDDIPLLLAPKGNALIFARTGYTALIGSNRETIVTKGYVDDAIQGTQDSLTRRAVITTGWAAAMNIGTPTPSIPGRTVYLNRVTLHVTAPVAGNNVAVARVMAGVNPAMTFNENDILAAGTYIADLPFGFISNNTQLQVQFFEANGSTEAIPTGGNITVIAEYKIL